MRILIPATLGAILLACGPALAWSENTMQQPASNEMAVWAYPTARNYCPAGLQPVVVGGVICCGQPTHYGYQSHPAPRRAHKPPTYVANGKGYIAYDKGYSGN